MLNVYKSNLVMQIDTFVYIVNHFLRRKGWQLFIETPCNFKLGEAPDLDTTLRVHLPDFSFPLLSKTSRPVVWENGIVLSYLKKKKVH